MKLKVKIYGLCPEKGGSYRIETFTEPMIQKIKKKKTRSGRANKLTHEEDEEKEHANIISEVIEIKRQEIVYEFPKNSIEAYIRGMLPRKIKGALGDIRNYFDSKKKTEEGGTLGLKKPFEMGWFVVVNDIEEVGNIIPCGYTKRFTYKGGRGGMGTQHYDVIDEITLTLEVSNPAIYQIAPHIEEQAIKYLESVQFGSGRHATLKILEE